MIIQFLINLKLKTINKMKTIKYKNFTTEKLETIIWLNSFTQLQFLQLYNGHNIFVEGCLGGSWDDKEFYNDNINDKDYNFFCEVFEEYFECGEDDFSNRHWLDIFLTSFNDKEEVLNDYRTYGYQYENL